MFVGGLEDTFALDSVSDKISIKLRNSQIVKVKSFFLGMKRAEGQMMKKHDP